MKIKSKEIWQELRSVLSGRTFDALLPPIVFAIVNAIFGLPTAVYAALGLAALLGALRLLRRQRWQYALVGLLGVVLAAGLALVTRSAASFFIPAIISSALLVLIALASNLAGKPLAAWTSHLTRGWPLAWFWRGDVRPAYTAVTWIWMLYFLLRLVFLLILFRQGEAGTLAWVNSLLGWPVMIAVLVISYIYGIWRLRRLKGPGVHEFKAGIAPPWEGQNRGF